MPVLIDRFPVFFHQFPYSGLTRTLGKRQSPVDLPGGVDVALAVFVDLGELAGAVVGVDLGAVEVFFRRGDAEGFGERVEAYMLAAPFAPFLHGVVDRRVAKTGKREVARRLDLVDDRALPDEAQIEVENIMADEEINIQRELPEVLNDGFFFTFKDVHRRIRRRIDGVTEAKNLRRRRRKAELLEQLRLVELDLRIQQAVILQGLLGGHGLDIEEKDFH